MKDFLPSLTQTLGNESEARRVANVLQAALAAADPSEAVKRFLRLRGDRLSAGGQIYALNQIRRVLVAGMGKASQRMAAALVEILGERIDGGVVVTKSVEAGIALPSRIKIVSGAHPVPDERSLDAARRLSNLLDGASADDLVIFLISGGGSSLVTQPVEGVSLQALQTLTQSLLACGADIEEINVLRRHLDLVKGGGLLRLAWPARVLSLILSDVVGGSLRTIASGPTCEDPSTYSEALAILQRYDLIQKAPPEVISALRRGQSGELVETVKPGDPLLKRAHTVLVGSIHQAAIAACDQAKNEGFNSLVLTTCLEGEARQAGRFLASILRQMAKEGQPLSRPACVIAGGETTVSLRGNGLGGRNQELALGAVKAIASLPAVALVSLATDGEDGPTDAAGAIVTGETYQRARNLDLDVDEYLRQNNAYRFFEQAGGLLKTGPTGTNVNDLAFLFTFKKVT